MKSKTSSARTMAVSASTILSDPIQHPSHSNHPHHINSINSSIPVQQIITADPDYLYFIGTSSDSKLRIRIAKSSLQYLNIIQLTQLYHSPVDFLMNTTIPLLNIYKGTHKLQPHQSVETYYSNTNSNGYCFLETLRQVQYRHLHPSTTQTVAPKTTFSDPFQRNRLADFITTEMILTSEPSNPDITRYHSMRRQLQQGKQTVGEAYYIGQLCFTEHGHGRSTNTATQWRDYTDGDSDCNISQNSFLSYWLPRNATVWKDKTIQLCGALIPAAIRGHLDHFPTVRINAVNSNVSSNRFIWCLNPYLLPHGS